MKGVIITLFTLSVLLGVSLASKQDVYGVCNQYRDPVQFENREASGNNCNAPSRGLCYTPGKRAFVPKCENAQSFNNHRFILRIGEMQYSIWKRDGDNTIYGGVNPDLACRATPLARYNQGDAWLIVIRPDASVYLVPTSQGCPEPPAPSNVWDPPQGEWQLIQSINAGHEFSVALSVGTSSTDSHSRTTEWSSSLTISIGTSLEFGFGGVKSSVSSTISNSIAIQTTSSLTRDSSTTRTFTCKTENSPQITMYQWVITAGHNGQMTTVANTPNIICVYGNGGAPQCPLGACMNAGCSVCENWRK